MRFIVLTCAAALLLALAPAVRALTVTVPIDYATIGAAIASGADVIKVNEGEYHENVTLSRALELRAGDQPFASVPPPFPTLDGTLTFDQPLGEPGTTPITVMGFRITGVVTLASPYSKNVVLRECRLESGLTGPPGTRGGLSLRGCIVLGNVDVDPDYFDVTCTTILGGGITGNYESEAIVRWNYIVGPADVGVSLVADDGDAIITRNVVIGTTDGIVVTAGHGHVTDNDVRRVSRHAFRTTHGSGPLAQVHFARNTADHPGGDGFNVVDLSGIHHNTILGPGGFGISGSGSFKGNTIDSAGAAGIDVSGSYGLAGPCDSNIVLHARGDGIRSASGGQVGHNVVGRCGGAGIALEPGIEVTTVRNNTSYLNGGHGFALAGDASASVLGNIAYGNQGFGLVWSGTGDPIRDCNDWFGNLSGAVTGTAPGATDLFVDPLFCHLPGDDVQLSAGSPLAGTACGQIGAKGVGCADPVAVPATAAGTLGFSAGARPATGPVSFTWRALEQPGALEVFDTNGARVWRRAVAAGDTGAQWSASDGRGAPVPPGVYFARLQRGNRHERQRIVVVR